MLIGYVPDRVNNKYSIVIANQNTTRILNELKIRNSHTTQIVIG